LFLRTFSELNAYTFSHLSSFTLDYIVEKLGIDESKIENLGNLLYYNYGNTMAGFIRVRILQLIDFSICNQRTKSPIFFPIPLDLPGMCAFTTLGFYLLPCWRKG